MGGNTCRNRFLPEVPGREGIQNRERPTSLRWEVSTEEEDGCVCFVLVVGGVVVLCVKGQGKGCGHSGGVQ